jgi:hypothetical protein
MSYAEFGGEGTTARSLGRPKKYTPQLIQQIENLIACGDSPEEIAAFIGVTVDSLRVTCRRLGIRPRRPRSSNGTGLLPLRVGTQVAKTAGAESTVATHVANTAGAEAAIFSVSLRYDGKEQSTAVPLTPEMICRLAIEASRCDLKISDLTGKLLQAVTEKKLFEEVLREQ